MVQTLSVAPTNQGEATMNVEHLLDSRQLRFFQETNYVRDIKSPAHFKNITNKHWENGFL